MLEHTPPPEIVLQRLRVRNFRQIECLDVEIPAETQVICLVGANGSGKSALMSWLTHSLCDLTYETAPDLKKGQSPKYDKDDLFRVATTSDIGPGGPGYTLRTDWLLTGTPSTFCVVTKYPQDHLEPQALFPEVTRDLSIKDQ